jgi:hypothetical protein
MMNSLHTHFVRSARAIIDTAAAANRYSRLPVLKSFESMAFTRKCDTGLEFILVC